jgi:CRISPR-associated endonuclease Csn1
MRIQNDLTLGIDLGIGSCGWAVIRENADGGEIVALGARTFDVPETDKERTPTNQLRRQNRGLRRVLRRRQQRMRAIRELFASNDLIPSSKASALKVAGLDPWNLRAAGLDRGLSGVELAVALGHIARHRGFRSNSKRDRGANTASDSSKMLKQIEATKEELSHWRTVGEMFAQDHKYKKRKRNRDGDYTRSILRNDQEAEVRTLLAAQRRLGNASATQELQAAFIETAFSQRPLQDSQHMVGYCPFEPQERRAARRSPSFERFRFLSRLTALRLNVGREERALTQEEIATVDAEFGAQKKISYKTLRKLLNLDQSIRFAGVSDEDEKNDFVARSGNAAEGTASLRECIVSGAGNLEWLALLNYPEKLDAIAAILTFREDMESIRNGLAALDLHCDVLASIMTGMENGRDFRDFTRAGHISAKASRAIIPHLRQGLVYSEACKAAGYDHSARPRTKLEEINNPVARKALTEALKQVNAIVQKYGLPGKIHVELARDVGKSKEERDEIKYGFERRNKEKDRLRQQFVSDVGIECRGAEDLLRYELWKEQNGRCLYTDYDINPNLIISSDNTVQVDHILPWSRSGDDGFLNKTLCFASANQDKKGRTPYEWFGADETRWNKFVAIVESHKSMKGRKKRNYLLKDASILEEKFRTRNLNDTRYACRLLAEELRALYPAENRRVYTRPGAITSRLRRAWGIEHLKKDADGKRLSDDRHHALDALIVAATSESALNRLTQAFQYAETHGLHRDFAALEPPWPGFISELSSRYPKIFVSRAERRRARGEGHAATVRRFEKTDEGDVVYERKSVDGLTLADLARIKDPERNQKLIEALQIWIEAGKPKDSRPLSPKGDPVSKVRLKTNKKVDVLVRGGTADRGEMTRVDVFRKQNKRGKWEFFLVPIYPHQVFDRKDWPCPPDRAVLANKPEAEWPQMTEEYEFIWSLYPRCFVEIEKPDGTFIDGYFSGLHRGTGAINIFAHHSKDAVVSGIGVKTLKSFRKFHIDRLGGRHEIERETRTWHGVACT